MNGYLMIRSGKDANADYGVVRISGEPRVVVGGMASTAERYSKREDFGMVSNTSRTSDRKILNVDLERRVP